MDEPPVTIYGGQVAPEAMPQDGLRLHLADHHAPAEAHLAKPETTPRLHGFGGDLQRLDPLEYPTQLIAALQEDQRRLRKQWGLDVEQLEGLALSAIHETEHLREELHEAEEGIISAEAVQ